MSLDPVDKALNAEFLKVLDEYISNKSMIQNATQGRPRYKSSKKDGRGTRGGEPNLFGDENMTPKYGQNCKEAMQDYFGIVSKYELAKFHKGHRTRIKIKNNNMRGARNFNKQKVYGHGTSDKC